MRDTLLTTLYVHTLLKTLHYSYMSYFYEHRSLCNIIPIMVYKIKKSNINKQNMLRVNENMIVSYLPLKGFQPKICFTSASPKSSKLLYTNSTLSTHLYYVHVPTYFCYMLSCVSIFECVDLDMPYSVISRWILFWFVSCDFELLNN